MQILLRSPLVQLRFLIQGRNYKNIHAALVEILSLDDSSLFAKIDMNSNEVIWFVEGVGSHYEPFLNASFEDRELVLDKLEEKKQRIVDQMNANSQIADCAEFLFRVPSENHIFFSRLSDGELTVVLTQWGIAQKNSPQNIDIIGALIGIPRSKFTEVSVQAFYKEGTPAAGETLTLFINTGKEYTTDESGKFLVGKMRIGLPFIVSNSLVKEFFTVELDREIYVITIPRFTSAQIEVVNQFNEPLNNVELMVSDATYYSDAKGNIQIPLVEYIEGCTLNVALSMNVASGQSYLISKDEDENRFKYVVEETIECSLQILVIDEHGNGIANYPVMVTENGNSLDFRTNTLGTIWIDSITYSDRVTVYDGKNHDHSTEITIDQGINNCRLEITVPPEKLVRVKLRNIDGSSMDGIELRVISKRGELIRTTDTEGYIYLPASHFIDGEKIVSKFYVLNNQVRDGKEGKKP